MRTIIVLLMTFSLQVLAENTGVMRAVQGDVSVTSGKTGVTTPAKLDQNIMVKDVVTTGGNGRAKVIMDDDSAFAIGPNSKVEIRVYISLSQGPRKVLFNLAAGKVRFDVQKKYDGEKDKFEVLTPATLCGVRGTDFLASFDSATQAGEITTFRGAVDFGQPGPNGEILHPVKVRAGMNSKIAANGLPSKPTKLEKGALEKLKNESDVKIDKKDAHANGGAKNKEHNGHH